MIKTYCIRKCLEGKIKSRVEKNKTNLSGLQQDGSAGEGTGIQQFCLRWKHLGGKLVKTQVSLRLLSVAVISTTADHERLEEERLVSLYSFLSFMRRQGRNQGPRGSVAAEATEECCSLIALQGLFAQPLFLYNPEPPAKGWHPQMGVAFLYVSCFPRKRFTQQAAATKSYVWNWITGLYMVEGKNWFLNGFLWLAYMIHGMCIYICHTNHHTHK